MDRIGLDDEDFEQIAREAVEDLDEHFGIGADYVSPDLKIHITGEFDEEFSEISDYEPFEKIVSDVSDYYVTSDVKTSLEREPWGYRIKVTV